MENKAWPWKRKHSEKNIIMNAGNEVEKMQEFETNLRNLNEKLTSALTETIVKDELLGKQVKVTEEAISGWKKAEAEATACKSQLDQTLKLKVAAEERLRNLDANLKHKIIKVSSLTEEKEQMVTATPVMDASYNSKTKLLEDKLEMVHDRLINVVVENSILTAIFEDQETGALSHIKSLEEEELQMLVGRIDPVDFSKNKSSYKLERISSWREIRTSNTTVENSTEICAGRPSQNLNGVTYENSYLSSVADIYRHQSNVMTEVANSIDSNFCHLSKPSSMSCHEPSYCRKDIIAAVLRRHYATQEHLDVILEETKVDLTQLGYSLGANSLDLIHVGTQTSIFLTNEAISEYFAAEFTANMYRLLGRLVELMEFMKRNSSINHCNRIASNAFEHLSEPKDVLHHFSQLCSDLLLEEIEVEKYLEELMSIVDWIADQFLSFKDIFSMENTTEKDQGREESHRLPGLECGASIHSAEAEIPERRHRKDDAEMQFAMAEMDAEVKLLELRLQTTLLDNDLLVEQVGKLEQTVFQLQTDLRTPKEPHRLLEEQIEQQRAVNEDLHNQLSAAKLEMNETHKQYSYLRVALEDKSSLCEDLEVTCLDQQLLLESLTDNEATKSKLEQRKKLLVANLEAASNKFAACQKTILNMGKQLKALASPGDAELYDRMMAFSVTPTVEQIQSLRERLAAEDGKKTKGQRKNKDVQPTIIQEHPICALPLTTAVRLFGSDESRSPNVNVEIHGRLFGPDVSSKYNHITAEVVPEIGPRRSSPEASLWKKLRQRIIDKPILIPVAKNQ